MTHSFVLDGSGGFEVGFWYYTKLGVQKWSTSAAFASQAEAETYLAELRANGASTVTLRIVSAGLARLRR